MQKIAVHVHGDDIIHLKQNTLRTKNDTFIDLNEVMAVTVNTETIGTSDHQTCSIRVIAKSGLDFRFDKYDFDNLQQFNNIRDVWLKHKGITLEVEPQTVIDDISIAELRVIAVKELYGLDIRMDAHSQKLAVLFLETIQYEHNSDSHLLHGLKGLMTVISEWDTPITPQDIIPRKDAISVKMHRIKGIGANTIKNIFKIVTEVVV